MDIKHAAPPVPLSPPWSIPQTVNMKDHGRKSNWTAQLSPYLRNLKIKSLIPSSPKSPKSPKTPSSASSPRSPRRSPPEEFSSFQIIHTPDRPERPISKTAIPNDEQCMQFLMSLQRQEENRRGAVKTGLKMWPYPEEEAEDRRYLRSVRVESVHLEEAQLARTNSSGPARVVEVGRSSTKSTTTTTTTGRRSMSFHLATPDGSDTEKDRTGVIDYFDDSSSSLNADDGFDDSDDDEEKPRTTVFEAPLSPPSTLSRSQSRLDLYTQVPLSPPPTLSRNQSRLDQYKQIPLSPPPTLSRSHSRLDQHKEVPLSPPPTLSRSQSRLDVHTPRAQTSRWSDDSESLFSTRDVDSPCPQRGTTRSSAQASSSPTLVGSSSAGHSSPPSLTPVKDRPATPFTDPRLRAVSDPTTPPPSDHIVHQLSPESVPRKYSWRSSKETILNTGAPVSRFQSWLPDARPQSEQFVEQQREREQRQEQPQQFRQSRQPEIEVYGDWADYYFEDGNFWDESDDENDGNSEEREEKDRQKAHGNQDSEANDDDDDGDDDEEPQEELQEHSKGHLGVDEGNVYPRYESFIKDYKNNVMSITVTEV